MKSVNFAVDKKKHLTNGGKNMKTLKEILLLILPFYLWQAVIINRVCQRKDVCTKIEGKIEQHIKGYCQL